jgi:hypothetical protein
MLDERGMRPVRREAPYGSAAERTAPSPDPRGAHRTRTHQPVSERACRRGDACQGAAGGGGGAALHRCGAGGGPAQRRRGGATGGPLQPPGTAGAAAPVAGWAAAAVRDRRTGADPGRGAADARPRGRPDGDLVAGHAAASAAPGARRAAAREHADDLRRAARGRLHLPARSQLVPDGHGGAQAQTRHRGGARSRRGREKT